MPRPGSRRIRRGGKEVTPLIPSVSGGCYSLPDKGGPGWVDLLRAVCMAALFLSPPTPEQLMFHPQLIQQLAHYKIHQLVH